MERGTTPLLLVLQFSDRVNMCPVRRSGGYIKKKKIKKMTSSGGHNFVDYTMHSVRGASLEPVKESFVSWLWGIVTLSTGFCRRKKNSSPRRDEVFFSRLWFIFPYHAGDPARYNRTTIYYTLRDQSMGKTRDLFLPRSFPSFKLSFSLWKDNWRSGCARTTTLIIVSKTMLLPRAARNSWRKVSRVESEISFWIVWKSVSSFVPSFN